MFLGEYGHTIDEKNRLIVPKNFRSQLGKSFYLTIGIDKCLTIYTEEDWEAFVDKLNATPITNLKARNFSRQLTSHSFEMELDKQGRILLPQKLREYALLNKEVVFVGVGKRAEIWDKEKWQQVSAIDDMQELAASMEEFGI